MLDPMAEDMKKSHRLGSAMDLNVYTISFSSTDSYGATTFPNYYEKEPKNDGVMLRYDTLPLVGKVPFNLGKTLTHEVGHWLGTSNYSYSIYISYSKTHFYKYHL
jgi:hypothetical protein